MGYRDGEEAREIRLCKPPLAYVAHDRFPALSSRLLLSGGIKSLNLIGPLLPLVPSQFAHGKWKWKWKFETNYFTIGG